MMKEMVRQILPFSLKRIKGFPRGVLFAFLILSLFGVGCSKSNSPASERQSQNYKKEGSATKKGDSFSPPTAAPTAFKASSPAVLKNDQLNLAAGTTGARTLSIPTLTSPKPELLVARGDQVSDGNLNNPSANAFNYYAGGGTPSILGNASNPTGTELSGGNVPLLAAPLSLNSSVKNSSMANSGGTNLLPTTHFPLNPSLPLAIGPSSSVNASGGNSSSSNLGSSSGTGVGNFIPFPNALPNPGLPLPNFGTGFGTSSQTTDSSKKGSGEGSSGSSSSSSSGNTTSGSNTASGNTGNPSPSPTPPSPPGIPSATGNSNSLGNSNFLAIANLMGNGQPGVETSDPSSHPNQQPTQTVEGGSMYVFLVKVSSPDGVLSTSDHLTDNVHCNPPAGSSNGVVLSADQGPESPLFTGTSRPNLHLEINQTGKNEGPWVDSGKVQANGCGQVQVGNGMLDDDYNCRYKMRLTATYNVPATTNTPRKWYQVQRTIECKDIVDPNTGLPLKVGDFFPGSWKVGIPLVIKESAPPTLQALTPALNSVLLNSDALIPK